MRLAVKRMTQGAALTLAAPIAALSGFGRVSGIWRFFAQLLACGPGVPGNLMRSAYYRLTLDRCSQDTTIAFGTIISHRNARLERNVSVGSYCIIGSATIGEGSQISSHVHIPGGSSEGRRHDAGRSLPGIENNVQIGSWCLIGASVVVLANIGEYSTVGAGSGVVSDIPARAVAVGNPARVIRDVGPAVAV